MTTLTTTPPQIIYWRNRSPEADSLTEALRADAVEGQLNLVETPDQFMAAINQPRTQLIVTHDPNMTSDVLRSVKGRCPDAVLVPVCDDEDQIPPEIRDTVAHLLSVRQLDKSVPLLKNALRQSSRIWSLKDAHYHCAAALSMVQDAVIVQAADHTISAWNPAAQKLFGWTDAEALGRHRAEVLTVLSGASEAEIAAALESAGEWSGEISYRGKDNRPRRVLSHRKPLRINGVASGLVEVCLALPSVESDVRVLADLRALLRIDVPLEESLERAALHLASMGAACVIDLQNDDAIVERIACASNHPSLSFLTELKGDIPVFASNRVTAGDTLRSARACCLSPVPDLAAFLGVTQPDHKIHLAAAPVIGALAAPILFHDLPIGVVTLLSVTRAFEESDARTLSPAASILGAAIERIRSEHRLSDARAKLRTGLQYKDTFLSTVSHELRTPLQAMLGWTHLLRENHMSPQEVERALNSLEENIKAQGKIVNDLLELSRINSGRLDLAVQPIELRSLLKHTLRAFETSAASKKIEMSFASAGEAPVWASADAVWLQRAFWNILSNSVKFTPNGGRVTIDVSSDDAMGRVRIADTGIGIEPHYLPHLFDSFSQADQGTTRPHHGLGVGLAITRHVIEAHGGTVEAQSEGRDKGSVFSVSLPLCAPHLRPANVRIMPMIDKESRVQSGLDAAQSLAGMRVLLVEDEADTRELLRVALRQAGADVVDAASAQGGLDAVRSNPFDVIVCDIGMPHEDGFSLIRKIRALPINLGSRTPAVALTAYASREDRLNALRAGFQMHMSKPVDIGELLLVVKSFIAPASRSGLLRADSESIGM